MEERRKITVFVGTAMTDQQAPPKLRDLIVALSNILAEVPDEFKDDAYVELDRGYDQYEDDATVDVYYNRPETDEDIRKREEEKRLRLAENAARAEARERAQLARLKAKYESA